jgi:hypothetical protein
MGGGGKRVRCKVDEEEVDDELDDLDSCDPFFPPDSDSTGGLEVVPVHDDVNGQIEGNWNVTLHVVRSLTQKGICTTEVCPIN